jgi:hypothetical protein
VGRLINAAIWLAVWIGIAFAFNAFNDPPRLLGEAIIPLILWFLIDWGLRRSKAT